MMEQSERFATYEDIKAFLANAKSDFEERVAHLERRFPSEMFPEFDNLRRHLMQISQSWHGVRHAMEERRWTMILEFTAQEETALREKLAEIENFSPQGRWEVMDRVKAEIAAAIDLCRSLAQEANDAMEMLANADTKRQVEGELSQAGSGKREEDSDDRSLAAAE